MLRCSVAYEVVKEVSVKKIIHRGFKSLVGRRLRAGSNARVQETFAGVGRRATATYTSERYITAREAPYLGERWRGVVEV